jgi:hypothetical protein
VAAQGDEAVSTLRVFVRLECGHSFWEHRPEDLLAPVDGELRVCAAHYPRQYPAIYSGHQEITREQAMAILSRELEQ